MRVVPGRTGIFFGRPMRAGFIYTVAGQKMTAGHKYTVAGGGTKGPDSGIPARAVKFGEVSPPTAVATDPTGDVLIVAGAQVWMVAAGTGTYYGHTMTAGDVYLVAGDGTFGQTGDGGPATAAEIQSQ